MKLTRLLSLPWLILKALAGQFRDRRPKCPVCGQRMDAMNEHKDCERRWHEHTSPVR